MARPLLGVRVEDDDLPFSCLIDTGSLRTRLPLDLAREAGVSLAEAEEEWIIVGGVATRARCARVRLSYSGGEHEQAAWFCDDWPHSFGLLGQEDFLRRFELRLDADQGWFELRPAA